MSRADLTRALVRSARALGHGRRPRKKLPRQQPPVLIENAYARAMAALVVPRMRAAFAPLLQSLPAILQRAAQARKIDAAELAFQLYQRSAMSAATHGRVMLRMDAARRDAGEGREARDMIEAARARLTASINTSDLEDLAKKFSAQTSSYQRIQLGRQTEAALGVNILSTDRKIEPIADAFVDTNVGLIKNLSDKVAGDVQSVVLRAIQDGKLHPQIAKDLDAKFQFGEDRAKLIARDQVGKLYGQVNAARQRNLGVEKFVWRSVGDERVRPEHAARDGKEFTYDDPPEGELPGEAVLCRCWAEPVFDDIAEEDTGDDEDQGDDSGSTSSEPADFGAPDQAAPDDASDDEFVATAPEPETPLPSAEDDRVMEAIRQFEAEVSAAQSRGVVEASDLVDLEPAVDETAALEATAPREVAKPEEVDPEKLAAEHARTNQSILNLADEMERHVAEQGEWSDREWQAKANAAREAIADLDRRANEVGEWTEQEWETRRRLAEVMAQEHQSRISEGFRIGVNSEIGTLGEVPEAVSANVPLPTRVIEPSVLPPPPPTLPIVAPEPPPAMDPAKALKVVERPLVPWWYEKTTWNGETAYRDLRKGSGDRPLIRESQIIGSGSPDAFIHVWPNSEPEPQPGLARRALAALFGIS